MFLEGKCMFKRKIYSELLKWKNESDGTSAILIEGARRIGKSTIAEGIHSEGKRIMPIEVKSSSYKTHKSFDYFKAKYQLKINEQYIIYTKDLAFEDNIMYIPIYMTMSI